jgi:hypothetical protein
VTRTRRKGDARDYKDRLGLDSVLTVASDSGAIHPGFMDVQLWNPRAGTLTNLTRSDDEYEEQAIFSPDGSKIGRFSITPRRGARP